MNTQAIGPSLSANLSGSRRGCARGASVEFCLFFDGGARENLADPALNSPNGISAPLPPSPPRAAGIWDFAMLRGVPAGPAEVIFYNMLWTVISTRMTT